VNEKENDAEAATPSYDPKEIRVTSEGRVTADSDSDGVDTSAQAGVQKIEATTSAWSKNQLILAYILYGPRAPCRPEHSADGQTQDISHLLC
jgi:hypothetical protein